MRRIKSSMQMLNDLLGKVRTDAPVGEVRRGVHWTAVVSRYCGLASTLDAPSPDFRGDRILAGMTALQLARSCLSDDIPTASLGLAALNSLIDVDMEKWADVDGLKLVHDMGKGKNISVIGHFPFLEDLGKIAANLWIIEKRPGPGDIPEERGQEYIARSDIVVISATTLINHTLQGILGSCREGSIKMLLGPSTPMSEVFFDYGIDILSGSVVADREKLLKLVDKGAGYAAIKQSGATRYVSMVKDPGDIRRRSNCAV
jgi:uncharacterized protein